MLTKEQEKKLNELCRLAFESLVGQIIIDENGTILYFSKEHTKFMGVEREEAEGKFVKDILPNTRLHEVVANGIPEIGDIFEMRHRDTNKVKYMICNRIPIRNEKGDIVGAMAETVFSRGIDDVHRLSRKVLQHTDSNLFTNEADYYAHLQSRETVKISDVNHSEAEASNIRGKSPQIQELKHLIARIANMPLPVLITGETGTGKEVFAEALHLVSDVRHKNNFVKINCAAIPGELLESELFGYEKGAFSGANSSGKIGKFEYAGNGTILLDEIGDMPMDLQVKLLRVLQEREFERVGGLKPIPFNARVVCTTNKNIPQLIKEGKFREDLYYRINVLELYIPPLRERKSDILEIGKVFVQQLNEDYGLNVSEIDNEVVEMFNSYHWPGNVRELKHVIERACMMRGEGKLTLADFAFFQSRISQVTPADMNTDFDVSDLDLRLVKMRAEKQAIEKALELSNGSKVKAAKLLGIQRSVLYEKLKNYHFDDL